MRLANILHAVAGRLLPRQLIRMLDRGITSVGQIQTSFGVSYLGEVPSHPNAATAATVVSGSATDEGFASSVHALRRSIRAVNTKPCQVVAVTSALPADGKTTSTIALARSAALFGVRTLLIDLDIRRATVLTHLAAPPANGLLEVLAGEISVANALVTDETTPLSILPLKVANGTLANIFVSKAMAALIAELRLQFDLILLDCAPVLIIADTRYAARLADCVVLVARWRSTPLNAVRAAVRTLRDVGIRIEGLALTRTPTIPQADRAVKSSSDWRRLLTVAGWTSGVRRLHAGLSHADRS